ncbi:MAG TPA: HAD family hydrolase [bacterium]|nr:HAD family hydrolase [bacterium]
MAKYPEHRSKNLEHDQPEKLVLFDIDGTLLHGGTSARESLAVALSEVAGKQIALQTEDVAGNTDLGIFRRALEREGFESGEIDHLLPPTIERYLEVVAEAYPARNDQYLYPGIKELLARLHDRDDIRLGLLTGNLMEGARIKLEPFDIWHHFAVGAFGSDAANRNDLPGIALRKARDELGEHYTADQTLIVGDTPRDALCAEVNDIGALIICRRPEWLEEIQQHHPYLIVNSTENVEQMYKTITSFTDE